MICLKMTSNGIYWSPKRIRKPLRWRKQYTTILANLIYLNRFKVAITSLAIAKQVKIWELSDIWFVGRLDMFVNHY